MNARALIADDEPLLAADLKTRLAAQWPQLDIVAVSHDGVDALARLQADKPDIAFLDIRMPGLSGLEVAARSDFPCRIVFVTAYDEYAIQAFEREAVDYLLKPVSDERLRTTVERLQRSLAAPARDLEKAARALGALLASGSATPAPLKWIRASVGDRVHLVPVEDIRYFQASDKYTAVITRDRELLIRTPLRELAQSLDPETFWQVHRSTLVNVRHVAAAHHDEAGRVFLELADRSERVPVSRAFTHRFKQM